MGQHHIFLGYLRVRCNLASRSDIILSELPIAVAHSEISLSDEGYSSVKDWNLQLQLIMR